MGQENFSPQIYLLFIIVGQLVSPSPLRDLGCNLLLGRAWRAELALGTSICKTACSWGHTRMGGKRREICSRKDILKVIRVTWGSTLLKNNLVRRTTQNRSLFISRKNLGETEKKGIFPDIILRSTGSYLTVQR